MRFSLFRCLLVGLATERTLHNVEGLARPQSPSTTTPGTNCDSDPSMSRRNLLALGVSSAVLLGTTNGDTAKAFPNKISDKYDDRPKRRGPQVRGQRPNEFGFLSSLRYL